MAGVRALLGSPERSAVSELEARFLWDCGDGLSDGLSVNARKLLDTFSRLTYDDTSILVCCSQPGRRLHVARLINKASVHV